MLVSISVPTSSCSPPMTLIMGRVLIPANDRLLIYLNNLSSLLMDWGKAKTITLSSFAN